jgi:type IV pilus assembly protein PilW
MSVRRQQGFTMVELMVAVLIGLFLLGALGILVFDNKRAFVGQGSLAQLQDGERMASTIMTDVIQTAGYFPNPQQNTVANSLPAAAPPSVLLAMNAGQGITGLTGTGAQGDSITVRYATNSHDGVLLCSGSDNETGSLGSYANTFSVVVNASNVSQLVCNLSTNGGAMVPYPLVNNVQSLTIRYGVNSAGNANNVDSYMDASTVTANNFWPNVVSVQLTITFFNPLVANNGTNAGSNVAGQGTYTLTPTIPFKRTIAIMNKAGI